MVADLVASSFTATSKLVVGKAWSGLGWSKLGQGWEDLGGGGVTVILFPLPSPDPHLEVSLDLRQQKR